MKIESLVSFLRRFRDRGGVVVFFSGTGSKFIALLVSIIVVRLLNKDEYGSFTYALMIVSLLLPITGAGMDIVLLRYGSIAADDMTKISLFRHTFIRGLLFTLALVAVLVVGAENICINQPSAVLFLRILSGLLVGEFFIRMLQNYLRVTNRNRHYALTGLVRSSIFLASVLVLVPPFKGIGYAAVIVLAPIVVLAIFWRFFPLFTKMLDERTQKDKKKLLRYGLLIGAGAFISQMQMKIDYILLGNLLPDPTLLAQYRVAGLIPINLILLPAMFFKTDFVHITKHHDQPKLIMSYLRHYQFLALAICLVLSFGSYFLGEKIITLIFGIEYFHAAAPFKILILGVCGSFLLRQPFGNLNNASGRADLNVINAIISAFVSMYLLWLLIPRYNLMGAATATAIMLWVSGTFSAIQYFTFVYRKLR